VDIIRGRKQYLLILSYYFLLSDYLVYCVTDKSLSGRVPLIVVCCVSNMVVG
jgi:hypothetical protein